MRTKSNTIWRNSSSKIRDARGFSILELMVAMIIFLVVSSAIWGVLRTAQFSRTTVNQKTELNKSVRFALNIIGRDTYNAGYGYPSTDTVILKNNAVSNLLGIPPDADLTRDLAPPIIAGDNITLNTFNTTPGVQTDQVTFIFKDTTFNLVTDPITSVKTSRPLNIKNKSGSPNDVEIDPPSGTNATCRKNDIMIVSGETSSALGVVTQLKDTDTVKFGNSDILDFNKTGNGNPIDNITVPASMYRVRLVTYLVTADGVLTRREYANDPAATAAKKFVDAPLVYNVENFQIQYVFDDGTISSNPQTNLIKVRQINFTISARSVELDTSGQPFRTTMSTTYSTRNLGYDAN